MKNARIITQCQSCGSSQLVSRFFAGFLPSVNAMAKMDGPLNEESFYPAELLQCEECSLVQLGCQVQQDILFPLDYPYTSGTTKLLRDNFADLARKCDFLKPDDLVVDIGSNDGTLLSNFKEKGCRVLGIEPTNAADIAESNGIHTLKRFFTEDFAINVATSDVAKGPKASLVTASNVFAHVPDVHDFLRGVKRLLKPDGVFVSESHYLRSIVEGLQYDTIYHEHLRYYSITSLKILLAQHGFGIVMVEHIPTHGGSIRVYAKQNSPTWNPFESLLMEEKTWKKEERRWDFFASRVLNSKLKLLNFLAISGKVFGVGAPSRATTFIHYAGLENLLECVVEVSSSKKIGHYIPGTKIPVVDEEYLLREQPDYALILSWHIADEIMGKLREKGYEGRFIIPLPEPRIV